LALSAHGGRHREQLTRRIWRYLIPLPALPMGPKSQTVPASAAAEHGAAACEWCGAPLAAARTRGIAICERCGAGTTWPAPRPRRRGARARLRLLVQAGRGPLRRHRRQAPAADAGERGEADRRDRTARTRARRRGG